MRSVSVMVKCTVFLLCMVSILSAATMDSPHDAAFGGLGCLSCHDMAAYDQPNLIPNIGGAPVHIDDSLYNRTCSVCHNGVIETEAHPHSSRTTSSRYGTWTVGCSVCHNQHMQDQDRLFGTTYGMFIRRYIDRTLILDDAPPTGVTVAGKSGRATVRFTAATGPNSFADGDGVKDGICEVCHTKTTHFRNDNSLADEGSHAGYAGQDCMSCHDHSNGFAHGGGSGTDCIDCHGHDAGILFDPDMMFPYSPGAVASPGAGTFQSHSTHTETDPDDRKGPGLYCDDCHDIANFPAFNDGKDLAGTTVCNTCHSKGGSYDGIDDPVIGAKAIWRTGAYAATDDSALRSGKEQWCAGCHDESPSMIGVAAPNVIGDEDGAYTYGTGWGYYKTGHGLTAGEPYPYKGGLIEPPLVNSAAKAVECSGCHDYSSQHIDGVARTFDDVGNPSLDPSSYRTGYRLKQVAAGQGSGASGQEPLLVPRPQNSGNVAEHFRLCADCHDPDPFVIDNDPNTNLVTDTDPNIHEYHMVMNNYVYPADWGAGNTSRVTCVVCHNVHGTARLAMVRDGKLTSREPGLQIWYKNDSISTFRTNDAEPPTPADLPLAASDGTVWIGNSSGNLCAHCHANINTVGEDRVPFQNVDQTPTLNWTGETGYTSDGAGPDIGPAGSTFVFRVEYSDTNNDAPGVIELWIDTDDSGTYDPGEMFAMSAVDTGDVNYMNGKLYTRSLTVSSAGDNMLNYRFYATDGINTATGDPTGDSSIELTVTAENNVPLLEWIGGTCRYLGVSPAAEISGAAFEFYVRYTDADDEFGSLQVWVDLNDDGDYNDVNEKQDMAVDGGDGDYSNGENFIKSLTLNYAGDGTLNYRFVGSDGTDAAVGDPAGQHTVTIINSGLTPVTVCAVAGPGCDDISIQSAIDTALGGDKLTLVYEGTYNENLSLWNSGYNNSIVRSVCGPDVTVISNPGNVVFLQNVSGVVLDGFQVTGGTTGINSNGGSATISNCKIHGNNNGAGRGGGLIAGNASSILTVQDSQIYSNTATEGAGVTLNAGFGHSFTNTVIRNNTATVSNGGAVFTQNGSVTFTDSIIMDNTAATTGGAVYANGSDSTFVRCNITGNTASGGIGGVLNNSNSACDAVFENCIVTGNSATQAGVTYVNQGTLSVINSTFADNEATAGHGGAIYHNSGTSVIRNSILWDNMASGDGHIAYFNGGNMTITDSVIASGHDGIYTDYPYFEGATTAYTLTVSGYTSENDPLFADAAGGDYHITSLSDGVDNGNAAYAPATDIDGDSRPQGAADDIGADELVFSNGRPDLSWTGEAGYAADGVDPDSAPSGTSFTFRVRYTDSDDDAPAQVEVWVDEDDNAAYSFGEKYPMTEVDAGDTDFTDGKLYSVALPLLISGDGSISYRFYASDGSLEANGAPTGSNIVTITNNIPVLSWTGETNFTVDGINPDSAAGGGSFEFRVDYTDGDNTAPSSIEIWADLNDDGDYDDTVGGTPEKQSMTETDGGDSNYTDGKRYAKSFTVYYAGDGSLKYRFYSSDGTDDATGSPAVDAVFTVTNNIPALSWTGEAGYLNDGVDPDSANSGDTYTFRVDYTDLDNTAPSQIEVWIDINDNAAYEVGEKFSMTEADAGDTDLTDGKRYSLAKVLAYAGDGIYTYRFYGSDGTADAAGVPAADKTLTVIDVINNAPVLSWSGANCRTEGVRPPAGISAADYEFLVNYTDADDQCATTIQVWVDLNDDGDYNDPGEQNDLVEDDAGDITCSDGKLYKLTTPITAAGDGDLDYLFYATDGVDAATGVPVSASTVTVVSGVVVRPSGSGLAYDYTSIIGAANAVGGNILVYPNDDFSSATYTETVALYNKDNRTIRSACGADLTAIASPAAGTIVTVQDSSNFVLEGFLITGATAGSGIDINRVDTTVATIRNSKITGNAYGIYINDSDNVPVAIDNVEIYSNSSNGILLVNADDDANITNSVIHSHNSGVNGPAISMNNGNTVTVTNSVIRNNTTTASGGAIHLNAAGASLTIDNSSIYGNQAATGGAVNMATGAYANISKSVIRDNIATGQGGAIYTNAANFDLTNSIIAGNQAGSNGGAISTNSGPTVQIINSTFADNQGVNGGVFYFCAAGSNTIRNSIFWNNTSTSGSGDNIYKACGGGNIGTISNSDMTTSAPSIFIATFTDGGGNLSPAQDPLFVNPAADNYHLQSGSPVRGQASATYAPADDIDGEARPYTSGGDTGDDMGADEYQP